MKPFPPAICSASSATVHNDSLTNTLLMAASTEKSSTPASIRLPTKATILSEAKHSVVMSAIFSLMSWNSEMLFPNCLRWIA